MDQNNGNGYNQPYTNSQNPYNQNQYNQVQYGTGQGMGQSGMNLPYNGKPGSFNPQINYVVQDANVQDITFATEDAGKTSNRKTNTKSMKLQDQDKKRGKGGIIAAIIAVVLIAAGIGTYFLFFTPEKRLERHLAAGQEALDAKEYDVAIESYEKALEIDDANLTAMKGCLSAYKENNDIEGLCAAFEAYRPVIVGMDQEVWNQNINLLADIYMMSELAYAEDMDGRIEALKEGMTVTSGNERIKNKLVDTYISCAALDAENDDYESALDYYDEILTLDSANSTAIAERKTCIEKILNRMIAEEDFDSAQDFIDEYKDKVDNVNFTEYEQRIENRKALAAAGHELLEDVIACMSAGNYDEMYVLDDSQNASTVYSLMIGGSYIYAPEGYTEDFTGTGAGLYDMQYGYYFYYGEYVDGERSGHGVYYLLTDVDNNTYDIYDGEWENDKPNGHGTYSTFNEISDGEVLTTIKEGDYTNGYQDGEFTATLTSSEGYTVTGSWTAAMGKAEDVRDQYPDSDFSGISEDRIVYAVLEDENGQAMWYYSIGEDGYLRIQGFQ